MDNAVEPSVRSIQSNRVFSLTTSNFYIRFFNTLALLFSCAMTKCTIHLALIGYIIRFLYSCRENVTRGLDCERAETRLASKSVVKICWVTNYVIKFVLFPWTLSLPSHILAEFTDRRCTLLILYASVKRVNTSSEKIAKYL